MSSALKELDRVLGGETRSDDEDIAALAALGTEIRDAFATFTPPHTPERAMFVRAVSDKTGFWTWTRVLAPATVTALLLLALLALGRTALPGGTFYPVRQVLRTVGLAPASVEEVQKLLAWADRLLDEAEEVSNKDPEAAERHAFEAVRVIGMAEGAYAELDVDERPQLTDELARLIARAKAILTEAPDEDADRDADGQAVIREDDDSPGDDEGDGDRDGDGSRDGSRGDDDDQGARDRGNGDESSGRGSDDDQDGDTTPAGDDDGGDDESDDDGDDSNEGDTEDDKGGKGQGGGDNSGPGSDDTDERNEDGDREDDDPEDKLDDDGGDGDEDERLDGIQRPDKPNLPGKDRPRD